MSGLRGGLRIRRRSAGRKFTRHKAEEFIDPSLIAELDKSGFIKKLYEPEMTEGIRQ